MTVALLTELRPLLRTLPGRKVQDCAERLAMLASADGRLRHGVRDSKLTGAARCSEKTAQRTRRYLEAAGILGTVPGTGHRATQYAWDLDAIRALTAEGGHGGGQQVCDPWGSSPRWAGRAPRGTAGWWDRRRMDALVVQVQRLRPTWTPAGIVAAAARALRNGATLQRLQRALLAVARAADSRYPMRVVADGWWWDDADARHQQPGDQAEQAQRAPAATSVARVQVQRRSAAAARPGRGVEQRPGAGGPYRRSDPLTIGDGSAGHGLPPWFRDAVRAAREGGSGAPA